MNFSKKLKCTCFTTISILIFAVSAYALDGNGTADNPYTISNATELKELSQLAITDTFEGKYIALTNDIEILDKTDFTYNAQGIITNAADTSQAFTPIGTKDVPFMGHFDGKDYTISGIYIDGKSEYSGLFGYVNGAEICNVTIFDSLCKGKIYAGMLCAYADGQSSIYNINVSGSVIGVGEGLNSYIGGAVGFNGRESTLSSAVSYANVSGSRTYSVYTGGVVGVNMGTVTHAGFGGKVHSEAAYFMSCCGGIAGGNRGYVEYGVSHGSVSGETSALVTESYVGGVVGQNANGTLAVCVNHGTVSNTCYNVQNNICAAGGVVGINTDAEMHQSANYGNITSNGVYAGGIAGILIADQANVLVASAHNRGSVTSADGVAGGIAGLSASNNANFVKLDACLNIGAVSGNTSNGILAFSSDGANNTFLNCYYGISSPADANAKSVTENALKSGDALTGFTTQLWSFSSGNLPFLLNEYGLKMPNFLICPQRAVVLYTGNDIIPDGVTLTKGKISFSDVLKDTGIYEELLVKGDMTNTSGYFAPAPCRMDVAIVTNLSKSQLLSVEYDEKNLMQINVSAYLPEGHSQADFVAAVYVNGALTGVTLETKQIDDSFYTCALQLPESFNAQVQDLKQVKIFVFDGIANLKPICQSKEA